MMAADPAAFQFSWRKRIVRFNVCVQVTSLDLGVAVQYRPRGDPDSGRSLTGLAEVC
jgi:hypothetical protein